MPKYVVDADGEIVDDPITLEPIPEEFAVELNSKTYDARSLMDMVRSGIDTVPHSRRKLTERNLRAIRSHFKEEAFRQAVMDDDVAEAERIAREAPRVVASSAGALLLHIAVERGSVRMASLLLNHGANPNVRDEDGMTPLHALFFQADPPLTPRTANAIADRLVMAGAAVNARASDGRTPLYYAVTYYARTGSIRPVEILVNAGARVSRDVLGNSEFSVVRLLDDAKRKALLKILAPNALSKLRYAFLWRR